MFRSRTTRFIGPLIGLFILLALLSQPNVTHAFFRTVDNYNDLVQAINDANANGGGIIALDPNGPYMIDAEIDNGLNAFPIITSDITIVGNGYAIYGSVTIPEVFRAFTIAPSAKLTLTDMIFIDFLFEGQDGGIILNEGELSLSNVVFMANVIDLTQAMKGGTIFNSGHIYGKDVAIGLSMFAHFSTSGSPILDNGHELLGAAIYNAGTMVLENADLALNIAAITNPASSATVYNAGHLTFNNVSLWGNFIIGADPSDPDPDYDDILTTETVGGLHSIAGSQTIINNSVILLNFIQNCQFDPASPVTVNNSYTVDFKDAIDNIDFSGTSVDLDDLTIPDTFCAGLTRMQDFELNLATMVGYVRIMPNSESIDGANADAMPYDRIGLPRNGAPDAGAYEYLDDGAGAGDPVIFVDYPFVYFTQTDDTVSEDVGTANIEIAVDLCGGCGEPFGGIFDIYIVDHRTGTATAGDDYTAFTQDFTTVTVDCTVGCPATVSLPVEIIHDTTHPEPDKTIQLEIVGTSGFGMINPFDQLEFELTIQDAAPIYPTVLDVVDANGISLEGITYTSTVDELTIQFNMDVFDDGAGTDPDSASNPANYILVSEGAVAGFQTASCVGGVSPDDTQINFASVNYDSSTYVTTLAFNPPLAGGVYQLIVCGTTSIVSAGNPLFHLNGGVDAIVNFIIDPINPPAPLPQPEDLGISELPATGERPLWAEWLAAWLGW